MEQKHVLATIPNDDFIELYYMYVNITQSKFALKYNVNRGNLGRYLSRKDYKGQFSGGCLRRVIVEFIFSEILPTNTLHDKYHKYIYPQYEPSISEEDITKGRIKSNNIIKLVKEYNPKIIMFSDGDNIMDQLKLLIEKYSDNNDVLDGLLILIFHRRTDSSADTIYEYIKQLRCAYLCSSYTKGKDSVDHALSMSVVRVHDALSDDLSISFAVHTKDRGIPAEVIAYIENEGRRCHVVSTSNDMIRWIVSPPLIKATSNISTVGPIKNFISSNHLRPKITGVYDLEPGAQIIYIDGNKYIYVRMIFIGLTNNGLALCKCKDEIITLKPNSVIQILSFPNKNKK